ncbi:uncharacterized protein COLE_07651 [Cutaneotrichosporon oleaginosum]|nr:hypothetical protein COLE_07651 [Cutaneotrichosporon oleaginosum]
MSPYNQYVKVQLAKLKEADEKAGVKGDHKKRFKQVAEMWKTAPENPVSGGEGMCGLVTNGWGRTSPC